MLPLLRCVLRALAVWPCCSWGGKPPGVRAQLVGWPVPVSGTGVIMPRSQGGVLGGVVPPALVQAFGRRPVPLALCPWRCCPPGSGPAADPGREVADELDAPSAARRGSVCSAACRSRSAGVGMVGMCARLVRDLLDRRRGSVVDDTRMYKNET